VRVKERLRDLPDLVGTLLGAIESGTFRWMWLRTRRRSLAYVRSAPATYGYLAILLATGWILDSVSDPLADRLLLAQSTNLHHLGHDPVRVLLSSAFWAPGKYDLAISAVLFTLVLAPVERRIGSLRTVGLFSFGHIGATLITAAGLWVALRFDAVERSVVNARDVGTSYGFFAVAAAMTYLLARGLRAPYAAGLAGYVATTAALSHGFGDYGHLAALALGFASFPVVRHASGRIVTPILARPPRGRLAIRSSTAAPTSRPTPAGGTD
jgi:hypothetical protein